MDITSKHPSDATQDIFECMKCNIMEYRYENTKHERIGDPKIKGDK